MEAPDIFVEFCRFFHQDVMILYNSFDAILMDFFDEHGNKDIELLKNYLAKRLEEGDVKSLQAEWYKSDADVFLSDQDILHLYNTVIEYRSK